jgi:3-oxoadipate enol-lactonase
MEECSGSRGICARAILCGGLAMRILLRYNFTRTEKNKFIRTSMPFAPTESGQIHYRLDGRQELPVLVFSNSLGADLSMWDAQMPMFSEHFRVLRYDSRGHGASESNSAEYTIELLAKDVITLLDHLQIATVSFCGLSVGGLVGQWLALHEGKRLANVVLCNTAAHIGTAESWNARIDAVRNNGVASISDGILERWFTPGFHKREPGTVNRLRKILEATPRQSYIATCAAIRDADFRNRVSGILTRTLVIAGARDKATPPEGGRFLAWQIVGAPFVELETAHLSNVELPQRFSEEVLKFLTS